jgi:hypothetical protein
VDLGLIGGLLHAHIHRSGHPPDFLDEAGSDSPAFIEVPADDLDVEGGRQPEVDRLVDDVGG